MPFRSQVPGTSRLPRACDPRLRRNADAEANRNLSPWGIDTEIQGTAGAGVILVVTPISLTANYNIDLDTDEGLILVSPDALGPWSIFLPTASGVNEGLVLYFKNTSGTDTFNVDVESSGTIDGTSGGTSVGILANCAVVAATESGAGSREWFFLEEPA